MSKPAYPCKRCKRPTGAVNGVCPSCCFRTPTVRRINRGAKSIEQCERWGIYLDRRDREG